MPKLRCFPYLTFVVSHSGSSSPNFAGTSSEHSGVSTRIPAGIVALNMETYRSRSPSWLPG
jgi:hypothetical protein